MPKKRRHSELGICRWQVQTGNLLHKFQSRTKFRYRDKDGSDISSKRMEFPISATMDEIKENDLLLISPLLLRVADYNAAYLLMYSRKHFSFGPSEYFCPEGWPEWRYTNLKDVTDALETNWISTAFYGSLPVASRPVSAPGNRKGSLKGYYCIPRIALIPKP